MRNGSGDFFGKSYSKMRAAHPTYDHSFDELFQIDRSLCCTQIRAQE